MTAPEIKTGEPPVADAVETKKGGGFYAFLDSRVMEAIRDMVPEGQSLARVRREIINAVHENPKILKCDATSIVRAVSKAVSWNLVIGHTAYLIPRAPRRGETQMLTAMQSYHGKIELLVRHGAARLVDGHPVYKNEHYKSALGTNPWIEHYPMTLDPDGRGELVGGYAFAKITQTEFKIVEISAKEIDAIRKKYSQQWADGRLEDVAHWYVPKTAIHRLCKQIPMSSDLAQLLTDDDDIDPEDDVLTIGDRNQRAIGAGAVPEFRAKPSTADKVGIYTPPADDPYSIRQEVQSK